MRDEIYLCTKDLRINKDEVISFKKNKRYPLLNRSSDYFMFKNELGELHEVSFKRSYGWGHHFKRITVSKILKEL